MGGVAPTQGRGWGKHDVFVPRAFPLDPLEQKVN